MRGLHGRLGAMGCVAVVKVQGVGCIGCALRNYYKRNANMVQVKSVVNALAFVACILPALYALYPKTCDVAVRLPRRYYHVATRVP